MDTQIAGNLATLQRRPLQPRNTPSNPAIDPPSSTEIQTFKLNRAELDSKENTEITTAFPLPAMASGDLFPPAEALSLAEELGAARRLKERLRLEREKTEIVLRDRDLVLEKEAKEAERRELEHIELELKLQSLLHLFELRSLLRFDAISSLRQQEEDKRKEKPLIGQNCASPVRCEAEDAESSTAKEKGLLSPISVSH